MKVALRSLLLAQLAAFPAIAAVNRLNVWQDGTRFIVDRWDDSRYYHNKIIFSRGGVKSIYYYTADGNVKKIVVGSTSYLVAYRSNGTVKKVTQSGSMRALREEDEEETFEDVDQMAQEGAAVFNPRRHLLTGYACEDCEDTLEKVCGVGLESVCNLVGYGSPFDAVAATSISTMCETFGLGCSSFTAEEVCSDNQCVDSCGNTCGDNAECTDGTCFCLKGFMGDPTAGCTATPAPTPAPTTPAPTIATPCNPNPCQNGGSCAVDIGGGHVCTCPSGFNGMSCQTSTAGRAEFYIELQFEGTWTTARKAVFKEAADRWAEVISHVQCGGTSTIPAGRLLITSTLKSIDGPYGVLGSAGPTAMYNCGISYTGEMTFDLDDVSRMESGNNFEGVIQHEMGHVIGVGTLWNYNGCSTCRSTSKSALWSCDATVAAYNDLLDEDDFTEPNIIELDGGSGTSCGHFDEGIFDDELMTGWVDTAAGMPLSKITIASLEDIGYIVDPSQVGTEYLVQADEYILPAKRGSSIVADSSGETFKLVDVPVETPIIVIDEDGKVVDRITATAMRF